MGLFESLFHKSSPKTLKEKGEFIEMHYEYFMVCEGCESAVPLDSVNLCPFCQAYRFTTSSKIVKGVGKKMQQPDYDGYLAMLYNLNYGR